MQRPHWPGPVTWRASLRYRSIFPWLNLRPFGPDLSRARPSTTTFTAAAGAPGKYVAPERAFGVFTATAVRPEWKCERRKKNNLGKGTPTPVRVCVRACRTPFMEQTSRVNSARFLMTLGAVHQCYQPRRGVSKFNGFFLSSSPARNGGNDRTISNRYICNRLKLIFSPEPSSRYIYTCKCI